MKLERERGVGSDRVAMPRVGHRSTARVSEPARKLDERLHATELCVRKTCPMC